MSNIVKSPVKRFPGTVTLPDFMTFQQAIAWEKMLSSLNDLREPVIDGDGPAVTETGSPIMRRRAGVTHAEFLAACVPGIVAVVETWNLDNFTVFQASPVLAIDDLIGWLISEISAIYNETEIPNS